MFEWMKNRLALATAIVACSLQAQTVYAPKPADFASVGKLPDFSGVWEITRGRGGFGGADAQPQLTPKYDAALKAYRAKPPQDTQASNCVPPGMPGIMGQPYPIEFLMTPGKVTIVVEAYMQVRHIYTDGRKLPEDPDLTYNGTSVGHWDKDTLVVETVGFSPKTNLGAGMNHSDKMKITERMHLASPDMLEVVTTVEDPEALAKPWTRTTNFARHRDWVTAEYVCQENNRNFVDESGKAGINLSRQ